MGYEFRNVRGHIEVYEDGKFIVSADNFQEARQEILKIENPCRWEYKCGWYDEDYGCTCSSLEKWYQCPMYPKPKQSDFGSRKEEKNASHQ